MTEFVGLRLPDHYAHNPIRLKYPRFKAQCHVFKPGL